MATRYADYPNIVWHVMGDFRWSYGPGLAQALDAVFHGIKDAERETNAMKSSPSRQMARHHLINSSRKKDARGYESVLQPEQPNTVYDYGSNSVEQFDKVYNRTGARPFRSSILSRRMSTPRIIKTSRTRASPNGTMRHSSEAAPDQLWLKNGGRSVVTGLFDGGPGWLNILTEHPQQLFQVAWTLLDTYVQTIPGRKTTENSLKIGLGWRR